MERLILPDMETVTLSGNAAEKLLRSGDGDAALLYLYILKHNGAFAESQAEKAMHMDRGRISRALGVLTKLGLVSGHVGVSDLPARTDRAAPPPRTEEIPQYTAADIKREMEQGAAFRGLVEEVQKKLGRLLSADDLTKLFGMYNSLGLPPEVILLLVSHCVAEYREKYGGARVPTMRYIEKAAYAWEREEILSIEQAERYLVRRKKEKTVSGEIRRALGITDRGFTPTEQRYVSGWIRMGFLPDAVEIAFDRTVVNTGKLSWGYMNSILESWHGRNIHTPEEIEKYDTKQSGGTAPRQGKPRPDAPAAGWAEKSAPSSEDIRRMKRLLDEIKNG